jgi:predicted enzyme related to lactoylglutathione lyase
MTRMQEIVFDCRHPASLARFWAAVLDGFEIFPYDEAEIERLRSIGIFDIEDDPGVLVGKPGVEPRLCFQLITESKVVKNRVHLDLRCDDLEAETERLVDLGAWVLATTGPRPGWVVLADPEGNEFCLAGPHPL